MSNCSTTRVRGNIVILSLTFKLYSLRYQQRQELAQETLQSEILHLQLQRQEYTNLR